MISSHTSTSTQVLQTTLHAQGLAEPATWPRQGCVKCSLHSKPIPTTQQFCRSFLYYGIGATLGLAAGTFDALLRYNATLVADAFDWAGDVVLLFSVPGLDVLKDDAPLLIAHTADVGCKPLV